MPKKKLIFVCIIILLIIGGCVQQLNDDAAISVFTPAPIAKTEEDMQDDIGTDLTNNSDNTTQSDNVVDPEEGGLPILNGQEDNIEEDDNSLSNSAANSASEESEKETLGEDAKLLMLPEILINNRVYFTNVSDPGYEYKFNSGLYSEQDLRLLSLMLQLIPSDTVNGVLKAFDSLVTPDINLTQFTYAGFSDLPFNIGIDKEVTYYKDDGLAFLSITRNLTGSDMGVEYILAFQETGDGFYAPLSVICVNPADSLLQTPDRIIITNNGKKYLLTTGQIYDYLSDKEILTRLYDCDTGKLVFSLPYKLTLNKGNLIENYSVELLIDTLNNYTDGFTIAATSKAEHTVEDGNVAPNGTKLLFEQDITIFVSGVSAYIEDGTASFFANFAPVKQWQYRTVFKDALNNLKKNGTKSVSEWAEDMLSYNRNITESFKPPEHELAVFNYEDDSFIFDNNYKFPITFTESDLYGIILSIDKKEHSSLAGVLQNHLYGDNYDLSMLTTLKNFKWSRISGDIYCSLVFPDINMDYVILEMEFAYKKNTQNIFLVFHESYDHTLYQLIDVQTTTNMDNGFYHSMVGGLLKLDIPSPEYKDKNCSRYYYNGELALETITDYTAQSGMYYNISLERDNIESTLYYCKVTAYLPQGIETAVYELPIWINPDGVITNDVEALKLLLGNPEEHEAFKILLTNSLNKITNSNYYSIEYRTEAENILNYFE